MSGLDVLRPAIIITSCREPRHEPDVEAIFAEGIRAELVSARAEGQFVAAFGADDRPPRYYRVFIELHKFLPSKKEPAGRAAGSRFIGKRRALGATAIWKASFVPSVEAIRRSAFACSFGSSLRPARSTQSCYFAPRFWDLPPNLPARDQRAVTFY
jgi:hypothetical protein